MGEGLGDDKIKSDTIHLWIVFRVQCIAMCSQIN